MEESIMSLARLPRYSAPLNDARWHLDRFHGSTKPLSFGKVFQNIVPQATTSLLFSLPVEIIDIIAIHIAPECCSPLALVSRDGLQLSRSIRFKDLVLTYGPSCRALLAKLHEETRSLTQPRAQGALPPLGPCVKRLLVCTSVENAECHHQVDFLDRGSTEGMQLRQKKANEVYFTDYLETLFSVLAHALPNLSHFHWESATISSSTFLPAILASPIVALTLNRAVFGKGLRYDTTTNALPPLTSLRCVEIDSGVDVNSGRFDSAAAFCSELFKSAAPLLQDVKLNLKVDPGAMLRIVPSVASLGLESLEKSKTLMFPRLRRLSLSAKDVKCTEDLFSIFGSHGEPSQLTKLELHSYSNSVIDHFLCRRGTIDRLRVFVWMTSAIRSATPSEQTLEFLLQNPQITKLSIPRPLPQRMLTQILLPNLAANFHDLTSLELRFTALTITLDQLVMISTIRNLSQLKIACIPWLPSLETRWRPDHSAISVALCGLRKLQKFATDFDFYCMSRDDRSGNGDRRYYDKQIISVDDEEEAILYELTPEEIVDFGAGGVDPFAGVFENPGFQRVHSHRMRQDALSYALQLPRLDWIYIGQRLFTLDRKPGEAPLIISEYPHKLGPPHFRMFKEG